MSENDTHALHANSHSLSEPKGRHANPEEFSSSASLLSECRLSLQYTREMVERFEKNVKWLLGFVCTLFLLIVGAVGAASALGIWTFFHTMSEMQTKVDMLDKATRDVASDIQAKMVEVEGLAKNLHATVEHIQNNQLLEIDDDGNVIMKNVPGPASHLQLPPKAE